MVSGHRIGKNTEGTSVDYILGLSGWSAGETVEKRRVLDVSGIVIPCEGGASGGLNIDPVLVSAIKIAVELVEHLGDKCCINHFLELGCAWPDVLEINKVAISIGADRIVGKIEVNTPSNGVSDYQRR